MASTLLGPGTLEIGLVEATLSDFSCEIIGGHVTHAYEDVGESRTMLCGTAKPASKVRTDGLTFALENDLSAAGLYAFLMTNDLAEAFFAYTPNTAGAASWDGKIQLTLPADIGSDEFGSPIVSDAEWVGVGAFTFTPAAAA
jgi:hypothetical protein